MPTYQYRCRACGEELEMFQKFTDPALTECPSCAGELRKVFSAVGVVFKGSGFYATDSRKPDPAMASSSSSESKSAPSSAGTSSSDTSTPSDSSSPGSTSSGSTAPAATTTT